MGLFLNKFFDLCLLTSFENRHRIAEDSIEQQRIAQMIAYDKLSYAVLYVVLCCLILCIYEGLILIHHSVSGKSLSHHCTAFSSYGFLYKVHTHARYMPRYLPCTWYTWNGIGGQHRIA